MLSFKNDRTSLCFTKCLTFCLLVEKKVISSALKCDKRSPYAFQLLLTLNVARDEVFLPVGVLFPHFELNSAYNVKNRILMEMKCAVIVTGYTATYYGWPI